MHPPSTHPSTRLRLLLPAAILAMAPTLAHAAETDIQRRTGLQRIQAVGKPKRDCWVYVPKVFDPAKQYPLVVVLHPAGLHGRRFVELWGQLADRTAGFIVAGPECKDTKRRLWKFADEADLIATIKHLTSIYSIDPARILLTGFSQGATYTYTFGLRNPLLFRAIAPVSGALIAGPTPEADAILKRARGLGVYIGHGAADNHVPIIRARASRDRLERAGFKVLYHEIPLHGHFYPPQESARIWVWFVGLTTQPEPPPAPKGPTPRP